MFTHSRLAGKSREQIPPIAQTCSDYLLVCEARSVSLDHGSWRFTLEQADGTPVLDAADDDMGDLNRLTLLAAVRGLESIDGPSAVTLLSNSRYLIRSLSDSLPRWRENDYAWEHFGQRIDIQHADLWRRIDRALAIHRVEAVLIASRLVSKGSSASEEKQLRIDGPQQGPARAKRPMREPSDLPADQLRRWLLGGLAPVEGKFAQRRFTAQDLIEFES